jgi:hypothetical protein
MTNRERLLAIMDRKSPDRIPWIPRMLIWYTAHKKLGTLPEAYSGMSLRELEHALGMGTPAREGRVFKTQLTGIEVRVHHGERETVTEYRTPVGTVTSTSRGTPELERVGIQQLEVEHMIKRPEDYDVVEYMIEHMDYIPTYDEYTAYEEEEVGEDGYPLMHAGDCPFHDFLQKLAGYEKGYLDLNDYPAKVEHLLTVMEQKDRDAAWPIIAESPARLILHGVHFGSEMTPPPMFREYITPYYKDFSALLHQNNKLLCFHADADSKLILECVKEAGFDMAETFTTAPMVDCTLADARRVWGTDVIIWGGVPSVILEEETLEEEFEAYMMDLFRTVAPGDAFILGVADNVMPAARIERIIRIGEMVEEYGNYPIRL